jgi:glycosyltransferase involved in cell wall biosynthesis
MADVGVFHNSLAAGGGAEAVGAHAIATLLAAGHDVTLYTDGPVDLAAVNAYHGTDIDASELSVHVLRSVGLRAANRGIDAVTALAGVEDLPLLRNAVADRATRRAADHDVLVSTQGELFASDAIQYVHFPYYSERAMRQYGTRFNERGYPVYHRLCRAVKPLDESPAATLTNSRWTADVITEAYGLDATVLYPPVRTEAFDPPPWADREAGFVAVGRVHHLKRQAILIEIIDGLREQGIETHLHIVGPTGHGDYARRVRQLVAAREYVTLEGAVSRNRLVDLLETHRYGLHGRRFEHFGIAVAEMVATGMVPFVPDSGGQVEVVGSPELTYRDSDEAVRNIAEIITTPRRQRQLRQDCSATRYGIDRFEQRLRHAVETAH